MSLLTLVQIAPNELQIEGTSRYIYCAPNGTVANPRKIQVEAEIRE